VVNNKGNNEDTITFAYNNLPQNWTISFEYYHLIISRSSSEVVIINITTDSNTSKGQYDIKVYAFSSGGVNTSMWLHISLLEDFGNETVQIGDRIQVDYIGLNLNGLIIDTSLEEIAKNSSYPKAEEFTLRPSYNPLKMVMGETDPEPSDEYILVIEGFWKEIIGMKVNETRVVRVPPEMAYNDGRWWIFEIIVVSIDS
jgi:hypothetical protein